MSRTEIKGALREEIRALDEKIANLQGEREALAQAFAAINGRKTARTPGGGQRRVRSSPTDRRPSSERRELARRWLAANPKAVVNGTELSKAVGMPSSSAYLVMEQLVERGEAEIVKRTPRGAPMIRYRPTTVRPGEEVKSND